MHYNAGNRYLFVNGTEIYQFKAKDSEIVASPLCLGSTSKDWSTDNIKKTRFTGHIYNFSVDYEAIAIDDFKKIQKYLMKKTSMNTLSIIKKYFYIWLRLSNQKLLLLIIIII